MQARNVVLLTPALCLFLAGAASAQTAAAEESRSYAAIFAGADFTPSDVLVGVEYGERVTKNVQAYATLTYFDNLISKDLQNELAGLSNSLTAQTGTPWTFTGRDRGASFVGGARYLGRFSQSVRPYVGAGGGALNIDRAITERLLGDVTLAVFNDYGIGSANLTLESHTGPLVELVAGIAFTPTRRTYVDIGYRWRKAFGFDDDVSFSQFSAGIGYRFY